MTIKNTGTALLGLATLLTLSLAATAQTAPTTPAPATPAQPVRGKHHAPKVGKVMNELDLTAAQKTQIKGIMKTAAPQRKAIASDTTLTPDQKKTKLKALREDTTQKIDAILTPEQKAKWQSLRDEKREAHKGKK